MISMGKICLHLQKRFIAQMQMGNCKHIQPVGNSDRFKRKVVVSKMEITISLVDDMTHI